MGDEGSLPKGWKIHLDRKKKDAWDTYRKFRPTAAGAQIGPEKGTVAGEEIATPEHEAMPIAAAEKAAEKIIVEEPVVEKAVAVEDKAVVEPASEPVVEKKAEPGKARVLSSSWTREKKKDKKVEDK